MQLLLLLILLVPGNPGYTRDHISTQMCVDVAEVLDEAVAAGVITQRDKNQMLIRCYEHAHK